MPRNEHGAIGIVGERCPLHHCATAEVEKSTMATPCTATNDSARKRHAQTDMQDVKVIEPYLQAQAIIASKTAKFDGRSQRIRSTSN